MVIILSEVMVHKVVAMVEEVEILELGMGVTLFFFEFISLISLGLCGAPRKVGSYPWEIGIHNRPTFQTKEMSKAIPLFCRHTLCRSIHR